MALVLSALLYAGLTYSATIIPSPQVKPCQIYWSLPAATKAISQEPDVIRSLVTPKFALAQVGGNHVGISGQLIVVSVVKWFGPDKNECLTTRVLSGRDAAPWIKLLLKQEDA